MTYCRQRFANYTVPRHARFVAGFPMTATGKIQKYRPRDEAITPLGLSDVATRRLVDR